MPTGEAPIQSGGAPANTPPVERPHVLTELVRGREAFLGLKAEWDAALASGPDPSPALEHDFVRLWLETFAPSRSPVFALARRQNRLAGALGFLVARGLIDGVPALHAEGLCNAHSTRGGLLLGSEGTAVIPALVLRALEEPWDVLTLRDVPREREVLDALAQALGDAGCTVAYESPMDSPYVPLPADWDELEHRLDARFRQNLRRRRRRLEEHGAVRFEVISETDGLDAALEDAFAIEASGWKGAAGGAIRSRPELVAFYASWARRLALEKKLRLCFLTVAERRVAFQFAFVARGRWHLPKCGFSESYAECSPGQLLMADVLKRCIEERLEVFEFLGFSMPWKRDWTPLVHPHATLSAYRPTLTGRIAALIRARLRPRFVELAHDLRRRWNRGGETE